MYPGIFRAILIYIIYITLLSAGIIPEKYAYSFTSKIIELNASYEKAYIFCIGAIIYITILETLYSFYEKIVYQYFKLVIWLNTILMIIAVYHWAIIDGSNLLFWLLFWALHMNNPRIRLGSNKSLKDAP